MSFILNNITNFLPEVILFFGIILQSLFKKYSGLVTLFSIVSAFVSLLSVSFYPNELYMYMTKILICISAGVIYCLTSRRKIFKNIRYFNFIYLFSIIFLMLITSVKDFFSLYVNIELFSICMYFLLSIDKAKISISETMKYLLMSCIASFMLLLGAVFLYGFTGSLNFQEVYNYLVTHDNYSFSTYIIPYFLILTGLLFKLGVFPFGNWIVDIYKNIDTKIVTFVSVVPKVAIFSALVKILGIFVSFETSFILILFALFSALYGCCYALKTSNLKELMACSSYLNVSYMLVALALYSRMSLSAMFFYWLVYIFMNIGAFSAIMALEHSNLVNKNNCFRGYFSKNPLFASCFAVCILSLIGLPVTGGFVAKIYLIASILNSGIVVLPLLVLLFGLIVLSCVFYIKFLRNMFMILPYKENILIKTKSANKLVLYVCTFVILIIGICPMWLMKLCESIAFYI